MFLELFVCVGVVVVFIQHAYGSSIKDVPRRTSLSTVARDEFHRMLFTI